MVDKRDNGYKIYAENELSLRKLLDNAKDLVYRYEIFPQRRFAYLNMAIEQIIGYNVQEIYENPDLVFDLVHPDDLCILRDKVSGLLDYSKPIITRWRNKKGQYVWLEDHAVPIYDNNNKIIAIEGICRDITQKKIIEEQLHYLGYHDALTGLKNRAFYKKEAKDFNEKFNIPVGLIICDIDNLKMINDTMGHSKGDLIIKKVSELLSNIQNNKVLVSRIGGDEFAVMLKNTTEFEVNIACKNIFLEVENYNLKNAADVQIELSAGCAFCANSLGNMEKLFKIADSNMYQNKLKKRKNGAKSF